MTKEERAAYDAKRQAAQIAAGLCTYCGKLPHRPNRRTCEECGRRHTELEQRRQRALKASGLCMRCKKPRDGAYRWLCKACAVLAAEEARKRVGCGEWKPGGPGRPPKEQG